MMSSAALISEQSHLLDESDGAPFKVLNPQGNSQVISICEHAFKQVPQRLNNLDLTNQQLESHIDWEPGAKDLALGLSAALDAPLIAARFSKLVYDCNRPPDAESAMPYQTEVCWVPGNIVVSAEERQTRVEAIYVPFHQAIADIIASKSADGLKPVIVTAHSFTTVFHDEPRAVEIGYLHGDDDGLSRALEYHSSYGSKYDVRFNQPYASTDGVLHTIDKHLESDAFPYVMIEVRNDLLTNQDAFTDILTLLTKSIPKAVSGLDDVIEARAHMMNAAAMGSTAFQKGLGAIHALSHPIGAMYHTHQCTTNAVCMPAVLKFNATPIHERFDSAAACLGIDGGFDGFCRYVDELNASMKIPKTLIELGVNNPEIDTLTAAALKNPSTGGNPIEMTSENTRALFEAII